MALKFLEKKKETFILLGIVVVIVSLIAWFYFDTLRLTPKTEKSQTTVQKKKKTVPQPSAGVVRKKIGTPATEPESPPETSTALQPEEIKTEPSDADTITLAPDNQDEKEPEDKSTDEIVAETTADKPADAPSSDTPDPVDASDKPDVDTLTAPTDPEPEEDGEVAQTPDKAPKETDVNKPSPEEDEAPVTPDTSDASELTASSYRIRQPLHPYSIKLSSNRSKRSAQNGLKVFKNDKMDPYVVQMDLGAERGVWWNIYTGHYKTRQDALNVWKTLERPDTRIKKLSYANLIDEFSSEDKMAAVYQRLEKQGYEPYVIQDTGKWRLFVGDFVYVEGAALRNQADLEKAGFTSRIVER
jgi:hypothetical protein